MQQPVIKSREEHRKSLRDILRLSAFFAYHQKKFLPNETLESIFRNRTPVSVVCFGQSTGAAFEQFADFPAADSADDLEEKVDALYGEKVDAFARDGYAQSLGVWVDPKWNFGSLRYDIHGGDCCTFHITNACAPQSIFSDASYLPRCFTELLEDARAKGCTKIYTGSWLNSEPRFIAFFPAEYREDMRCSDELTQWHFGYWGQIFNARGLLNGKVAAFIREHHKLPYQLRRAGCSIAAMCEHLKTC